MRLNFRGTTVVATALLFATTACVQAAATLPGPVVSPQWLADHLHDVVVLNVRSDIDGFTAQPEYDVNEKTGKKTLYLVGGHVPGAHLIDFSKVRTSRVVNGTKIDKLLPDAAAFEAVMQSAGVPAGKPLVITANGQSFDEIDMAARLYWSLKVYGATELAILDGGDAGWLAAGKTLVSDKPAATRGTWKAGAVRKDILAEAADVEQAAKAKVQLVDARSLPQYLGLSFKKPAVTAGGHVAGARNFPTDVHTKGQNGAQVFLTPAEYRGVFKQQGIDPENPSITYCNTGHLASGAWFVMSELLGNPSVRMYDGSMHEWTTTGHPVVKVTD